MTAELAPKSADQFIDNNENFKSCFARSVAVNSQYKQSRGIVEDLALNEEKRDSFNNRSLPPLEVVSQDSPVRYRKNSRTASMDDSRRFSCGSIVSRRASMAIPPKRNEMPVENIFNQHKIDTLQWQLTEIEKSRGMYKAVMKQIVTFLEKAHVSLEHLSHRLNQKTPSSSSVPRSKSEHHIVLDCSDNSNQQQSLVESWNTNKKPDNNHPDEIPPEKLSQEAFRLLRTAQSLLSTQEPNLASSESLNSSDEPSDIEFLAQLAQEFPIVSEKRHRATSFSVSPKLIFPEKEVRISTAFNRKLSLQLSECRKNSPCLGEKNSGLVLVNTDCYSLPPGAERFQIDPLRNTESPLSDQQKTPDSPATGSVSSVEDESGFSSMTSFQDVGLPLVNSTGIDEVSARSVLLKSMLHNNCSDYSSLSNDSDHTYSSISDVTLTSSPPSKQGLSKRSNNCKLQDRNPDSLSSDVKLWQKPSAQFQMNGEASPYKPGDFAAKHLIGKSAGFSSPVNSQAGNHKRWHSTPEPKNAGTSVKVLWV